MLIQADWATQKSIIRLSDRKLTGWVLELRREYRLVHALETIEVNSRYNA